ncbi:serine/threonine-protein kinase [Microbispora oryzae]|uniref:serine/threonine-protein kinase n=1 Tax=Microbispora oryzae TaxID=2806554 RepID=UPI001E624B5A|nr:serine/threonine-protein kinase [Microbispora oryzae]
MNHDDRLGPYRLLRRLGEGGMGVVHLALDPQGRQVAVKVLRSEVTGDDVARRRLSREVETMRRVRNPHIAEVVDADVTGRRPYIVTRYVPGRSLDEIVKQDGPLPLDAQLKVARGVAEALAAVHATGVIHRDLKPGNVLMLDGQPVLIDFGIAQAVDATRLTQTGMFIGTPGYLAPEIIEGHEAGPAVDVHAWAGTLLYAATGLPPFGKGTLEMIFYNITSGRANIEGAPEPLRPVLRAAFHRDPVRRPTAADLVRMVGQLMPGHRRPRVPDEITTVPNVDDPSGGSARPATQPGTPPVTQAGTSYGAPPVPGPATPVVPATPSTPLVTPPVAPVAPPPVPGSRPSAEEYVSLLGDGPAPGQQGDPFPTVRVTGEDLRRAGLGSAAPAQGPAQGPAEGDIPTWMAPPQSAQSSPQQLPQQSPHSPLPGQAPPGGSGSHWPAPMPRPEGDVPTRRVSPEELRQAVPQAFFEQGSEIYEKTPHVHQAPPSPFMPTVRVPPPTAQSPLPAGALQRPKTYGLISVLLLVVMTCLTVIAPLLVCVVAIPAVVLLRAADIAQPYLAPRRPAAVAAGDVIRVLGRPDAIVKSIAVTIALVPYALVLGLPVTLLLTVLVASMPPLAALSWGIAVALWTICAGPGVEGPSRQARRTLASLLPGSAAQTAAVAVGALAVLVAAIALGSVVGRQTAGHFWGPIDVLSVVQRLSDLRVQAGTQ